MKPYYLFILTCAFLLFNSRITIGQVTAADERYIDYNAYFNEALVKGLQVRKDGFKHTSLTTIQDSAALLGDDRPPAKSIQTIKGKQKVLNDEAIFSLRSKSVFVVGKLISSGAKGSGSLNFDLIGTAFAIEDGNTCVTNYHVLKNMIHKNEEASTDSLYFIITTDKKLYFINEILAFSQNNDLAIFKVNTFGHKLVPIPLGKPADIGAPVYCISNPRAYFNYFSKGIVARNITLNGIDLGEQFNKDGRPPIRMEITADYGVGSSGGPILDKFGNLIGIVVSTSPIYGTGKDKGKDVGFIQMMVKDTTPVKALADLLSK